MSHAIPIVGLTAGRTQDGRSQIDGAACLVHGDRAWGVAEERLTRRKHAGGCESALAALLSAAGLSLGDVGLFVVSTCGEAPPDPQAPVYLRTDGRWTLQDMGVEPDRIVWCPSHHLSHALHAAHAIAADHVLICVFDREGTGGERASYYLANGLELELLHQDVISGPFGGAGWVYAQATAALGWSGDMEAGKTMALAAYGAAAENAGLISFDASVGLMKGAAPNGPPPVTFKERADLAATVQTELEEAVIAAVGYWNAKRSFRAVCIAGGVGTNCRLLGALARSFPDKIIRAPYAPGDTGQAVGNALYGCLLSGTPVPELLRSPFLGPNIPKISPELFDVLGNPAATGPVASLEAARLVAEGGIVGICIGRSEFGPRALGGRSLLCRADQAQAVDRLNRDIKRREWFRPFGVMALQADVTERFPAVAQSQFMEIAQFMENTYRHVAIASVHIDRSCRLQSVTDKNPCVNILREIRNKTSNPFLVNTSFNRPCEPIIENYYDAVNVYLSTGIDGLLINHDLFIK
jgi:carbamoyltransferase